MKFTLEEYEKDVENLRRNRENVALEDLKGKYAKPYNQLLEKIKTETEYMLKSIVLSGIIFKVEDKEDMQVFIQECQGIVDSESVAISKISHAVFKEYDIEKAMDAACSIHSRVLEVAYRPYWIKNCQQISTGEIWNSLIDMIWDFENQIWKSKSGETWSIMLPPEDSGKGDEESGNKENRRCEKQVCT